jgi:hypothetical protein
MKLISTCISNSTQFLHSAWKMPSSLSVTKSLVAAVQ